MMLDKSAASEMLRHLMLEKRRASALPFLATRRM
jgi:hypothetical protein